MKPKEELKAKKKKKKIDGDVFVVLGVLGGIILLAVLVSFFQAEDAGKAISGELSGNAQGKEMNDTLKIVLTCAFFSAFFVCLLIIKTIRDKRRKKRLEEREKLEKLQKLEEARERVKRAKLDAFMQYGNAELEKRRREEELLRRSARRSGVERSYRERGEYRRRDLNQFKEEDFELNYEEELSWFQRLIRKIKSIFSRNRDEEDID